MDAQTQVKLPAFDHDRIAAALGTATGKVYSGLHLPFTEPFASVQIIDGGRTLNAEFDEAAWQCSLTDYVCSRLPPHGGLQPRGFETVRDPKIPADNSPRVAGRQMAGLFQNWNLAMRDSSGGETILLSTDGSQGEFYDPESIAWSPDSRKLAAYRVRPGFPREVTRVISSPPEQVQPRGTAHFGTRLKPRLPHGFMNRRSGSSSATPSSPRRGSSRIWATRRSMRPARYRRIRQLRQFVNFSTSPIG